MGDINSKIRQLHQRLDTLRTYQQSMEQEIRRLEGALASLQQEISPFRTARSNASAVESPVNAEEAAIPNVAAAQPPAEATTPTAIRQMRSSSVTSNSIETFIGTNLISKIGILITIVGVFIGARYAIDRDLISPTTRIIISYIFAIAMAGVGFRLKKKYEAFSAVLIGGSIAIIYFSTFIAHSYYHLLPQLAAFTLMLVTTAAAVGLSMWYNRKIIALIGQVAAYAIPILLSEGSGKLWILFTYISIINAGLMFLSFRKDWKIIYWAGFLISWGLYAFSISDNPTRISWQAAMLFITVNFFTFFITYLAYKIVRRQLYSLAEVAVLLLNSVLYFAIGYNLLDERFDGTNALTWFTLFNAALYLSSALVIRRLKLADTSVMMFLAGQGLTFITIAVPVKLDGNWVTLLWSIETAILLYVGSRSQRNLYFKLAAVLMVLMVISLIDDWSTFYNFTIQHAGAATPFFNRIFFTGLISAAVFAYGNYVARKNTSILRWWSGVYLNLVPLLSIAVLYICIFLEINWYYVTDEQTYLSADGALRTSVLLLYSLAYLAVCILLNARFVRSEELHFVLFICSMVAVVLQLTLGLSELARLDDEYRPWLRYVNFTALGILWFALLRGEMFRSFDRPTQVFLMLAGHATLLTLISTEYIHWLRFGEVSNQYKLGLTIIFGAYALFLIVRGLIRDAKYLRIAGMALFGFSILKLFFYDLQSVSTIVKTIVMVALGALLLAASYMYNKFLRNQQPAE